MLSEPNYWIFLCTSRVRATPPAKSCLRAEVPMRAEPGPEQDKAGQVAGIWHFGSSLLGWRPSLLGWKPSLLDWRPWLLGRPSSKYITLWFLAGPAVRCFRHWQVERSVWKLWIGVGLVITQTLDSSTSLSVEKNEREERKRMVWRSKMTWHKTKKIKA